MLVDVVFMNVGQGDGILVYLDDQASPATRKLILIDYGSTKGSAETYPEVLKVFQEYLDKASGGTGGPYVLDHLFLTHGHVDHYNQLYKLLALRPPTEVLEEEAFVDSPPIVPTIQINQVWYGGESFEYGPNTGAFLDQRVRAGTGATFLPGTTRQNTITVGTATVSLLGVNERGNPVQSSNKRKANGTLKGPTALDRNGRSLVLLLQTDPANPSLNHCVYLTGDATTETEREILARAQGNTWMFPTAAAGKWLKVGHHGSPTSSGSDWIKTIGPTGLIVSATNSSHGLPDKTTLDSILSTASVTLGQAPAHDYMQYDRPKKSGPAGSSEAPLAADYNLYEIVPGYSGDLYTTAFRDPGSAPVPKKTPPAWPGSHVVLSFDGTGKYTLTQTGNP
ncbi:ComEC/Rec2 family competence protein [Streptomyces clavuligerus]|uniref:ComEC/Rec2 family competence protein n=1 Tax=Streptomyces clavuligerus TaxID=1901 RepID=UPI0001851609|nr:hypothetical protein [Streptomyces clavuligerus]WDN56370.1 hypothetical protein LL058_31475 [Streptomyces clavuligerus]